MGRVSEKECLTEVAFQSHFQQIYDMANIKELSLKLEYAILEQNINKISLLFQEIINGSGDKGISE